MHAQSIMHTFSLLLNFVVSNDSVGLGGSDGQPTEEQEVAGLIPAGSATFFCRD